MNSRCSELYDFREATSSADVLETQITHVGEDGTVVTCSCTRTVRDTFVIRTQFLCARYDYQHQTWNRIDTKRISKLTLINNNWALQKHK